MSTLPACEARHTNARTILIISGKAIVSINIKELDQENVQIKDSKNVMHFGKTFAMNW